MRILWPLIWPNFILEVAADSECTTCPTACGEGFNGDCSCMFTSDGTELTICEEAPEIGQIDAHHLHGHDEEDCDTEDGICVTHIGVMKWTSQWPKTEGLPDGYNREIPWTYDTDDDFFIQNVHIAMDELQKDLQCVKLTYKEFDTVTADDIHGLLFTEGDSCMSYVGYTPGKTVEGEITVDIAGSNFGENWQTISMNYQKCFLTISAFQHEVLHALGLFHEFDRPDRDQFIDIIPNAKLGVTIEDFSETLDEKYKNIADFYQTESSWVDKAGFQTMSHSMITYHLSISDCTIPSTSLKTLLSIHMKSNRSCPIVQIVLVDSQFCEKQMAKSFVQIFAQQPLTCFR